MLTWNDMIWRDLTLTMTHHDLHWNTETPTPPHHITTFSKPLVQSTEMQNTTLPFNRSTKHNKTDLPIVPDSKRLTPWLVPKSLHEWHDQYHRTLTPFPKVSRYVVSIPDSLVCVGTPSLHLSPSKIKSVDLCSRIFQHFPSCSMFHHSRILVIWYELTIMIMIMLC